MVNFGAQGFISGLNLRQKCLKLRKNAKKRMR